MRVWGSVLSPQEEMGRFEPEKLPLPPVLEAPGASVNRPVSTPPPGGPRAVPREGRLASECLAVTVPGGRSAWGLGAVGTKRRGLDG